MQIDALQEDWDVAVIGAGVAGSASAIRLAGRGLRVVLMDKAAWPRDKVCGGCINGAALDALSVLGLRDVADAGPVYSRLRLACAGRQAGLTLPAGRAVSRGRLDALLAEGAVAAGACFLPGTRAVLERSVCVDGSCRWVRLRQGNRQGRIRARLVLVCGGLGSRFTDRGEGETGCGAGISGGQDVAPDSRIGLGTLLDPPSAEAPPWWPGTGSIHMACGAHGYVGLVRVEDNRINVAAALDPAWIKGSGGPACAVARTLEDSGLPAMDTVIGALMHGVWRGTPRLTRRRHRLGARRVLLLGDAAGYVEPFTGEGMAWALAGAAAVEPLAMAAMQEWRDGLVEQWSARHAAILRPRQRICRGVAALLRRPGLVRALLPLINTAPGALAPLIARLNHDPAVTLEPHG